MNPLEPCGFVHRGGSVVVDCHALTVQSPMTERQGISVSRLAT